MASPPSHSSPPPYELLDDGQPVEQCDLLVIGCGNILRGDDAVGPVLVRHLLADGVPNRVRVVDGGTAGMDVAFAMRGAARVVIVDASATGAKPGTVYRVPAEQLGDLPPMDGLHTHNFRWDHALSFADWLLGPHRPRDVTVFLVEAGSLEPSGAVTAELSAPVEAGMRQVLEILRSEFFAPAHQAYQAEITAAGYLHLPAVVAQRYLPSGVLVARATETELELLPLHSMANGGLLLKQRNAAGDRSLLINEVLRFRPIAGLFPVEWRASSGSLIVNLAEPRKESGNGRLTGTDDRGGAGAGPVGGVHGGSPAGRGATQPDSGVPQRTQRPDVEAGARPDGRPTSTASGRQP